MTTFAIWAEMSMPCRYAAPVDERKPLNSQYSPLCAPPTRKIVWRILRDADNSASSCCALLYVLGKNVGYVGTQRINIA
ncbi:hypothetical protein KCP77_17820 [Salmonella enterica subsp. enterica]|nr:hypothetical protein KCP77_17820 [Salmonella enterica subsp. enterica]